LQFNEGKLEELVDLAPNEFEIPPFDMRPVFFLEHIANLLISLPVIDILLTKIHLLIPGPIQHNLLRIHNLIPILLLLILVLFLELALDALGKQMTPRYNRLARYLLTKFVALLLLLYL
jgi:hypothetical protein